MSAGEAALAWAQATARPVPPASPAEAGLKLVDWASMTVGGSGTAVPLAEWDRVKQVVEAGEEVAYWRSRRTGRWYQVSRQPNGITGPRNPTIKAAGRFKAVGKGLGRIGLVISAYQWSQAWDSTPKNRAEAVDREKKMTKAGVDFAMGLVGFMGPIGFTISTIYFVVDTGISLGSNGERNILDLLGSAPVSSGPMVLGSPREFLLAAPADNTRVFTPRRVAPRSLGDILRQTPVAAHNAVFRPANR